MNSTLFGIEGAVEDFLYSQGGNRVELTVGGRTRRSWNGGYAELKLTRIQRCGNDNPYPYIPLLARAAKRCSPFGMGIVYRKAGARAPEFIPGDVNGREKM